MEAVRGWVWIFSGIAQLPMWGVKSESNYPKIGREFIGSQSVSKFWGWLFFTFYNKSARCRLFMIDCKFPNVFIGRQYLCCK